MGRKKDRSKEGHFPVEKIFCNYKEQYQSDDREEECKEVPNGDGIAEDFKDQGVAEGKQQWMPAGKERIEVAWQKADVACVYHLKCGRHIYAHFIPVVRDANIVEFEQRENENHRNRQ